MQDSNNEMVDGTGPQSGADLDVWGGRATTAVLIPDRGRADNGCPLQEAGRCPPGCLECWLFDLSLAMPGSPPPDAGAELRDTK